MSGHDEEDRNSEDAAPIFNKFSSLKLEDKCPPGRVVTVTLPCGHQMPQDYLIAWCVYNLKQKKIGFSCPRVKEDTKKACFAGFSYHVMCQSVTLTTRQKEFFEEKLGALAAAEKYDCKSCPGCQSFVERANKNNLCVRCTICTANMGRTYEFCWNCKREWKGPVPNSVRCDNPDCGKVPTPHKGSDSLKLCKPEVKKKLQTEQIYPMKEKSSDRKRLALIINNMEFNRRSYRKGAEKDEESMRILLEGLGYDVIILNNMSAEGMEIAVRDFSQRSEHKNSDSTFVVIMSHGGSEGIDGIYCCDNENDTFLVEKVFHYLNSENCTNLIDKPKIILVQACRGDEKGYVWVHDSGNSRRSKKQHREKDFGCLRSCTPDTVANRNTLSGSVFIQKLVNIFNEHAHEDDIMELFRRVIQSFEDLAKKEDIYQTPCVERTSLAKKFYLFPGI